MRLTLSGFPGAACFNDRRRAIAGPEQLAANPLQRPGWLRGHPARLLVSVEPAAPGAGADPRRKDGQATRWGLSRSARHMAMNVTKILVPIDYSDQSDRALQWGASLAEKYGAGGARDIRSRTPRWCVSHEEDRGRDSALHGR